jgi:Uma2 family endonuclease
MSRIAELLTLAEFEALPEEDGYRLELSRGRLVREPPPGARHGWLVGKLFHALDAHAREHALGVVLNQSGFLLSVDPPTVRDPDLAFLTAASIPREIQPGFWRLSPDLAVEVLSPSNSAIEIHEKILDYLVAGTRLVWVVDPHNETVVVHGPDRGSRTLARGDVLSSDDVLPGFRLPLAELFGP